jgi:RecJ-like exonuclease
MDKMIAYCGIVCTECPAFIATQQNDDAKRKQVAETWSKQYKMTVKAEDINCDGCTSGGKRLLNYCSICEIRKCGQGKGVKNCAYCDEYACEKLTRFLAIAPPETKASLEEIRKKK